MMKTFCVTEEYISTITYIVEAETEAEAKQLVRSGTLDGDMETDVKSGEIISIEDISAACEGEGNPMPHV